MVVAGPYWPHHAKARDPGLASRHMRSLEKTTRGVSWACLLDMSWSSHFLSSRRECDRKAVGWRAEEILWDFAMARMEADFARPCWLTQRIVVPQCQDVVLPTLSLYGLGLYDLCLATHFQVLLRLIQMDSLEDFQHRIGLATGTCSFRLIARRTGMECLRSLRNDPGVGFGVVRPADRRGPRPLY